MNATVDSRPFVFDPDDIMPEPIQRRHHDLGRVACDLYGMRNAAKQKQDVDRATFYHETGDLFFLRSRALLAEWDVDDA